MSQLALPLKLADHAVFASFLTDGNETLVATLVEIAADSDGHGCWLWGAHATGKTHLLQAVCEAAGDCAVYLPLQTLHESDAAVLDGLASREIICLDEIDCVVGNAAWEAALFDLCNQLQDAGGQLIVAGPSSPRESAIEMPDLSSRLSRLPVFQLHILSDEQRLKALQLRSSHRGLDLPDDTARFLLNRSRRDMASLYDLLDRLDSEALRAKRRLTIPFISEVLSVGED